jgi:branched-chain amino acid transport system substrate-binding protein
VGVYGAPPTSAILPLVEREGIPFVAPITSQNLTNPMRSEIFVVRPTAEMEAEFLLGHLLQDLGIKDIGVFYQDDAYGKAGLAGVSKLLAARGVSLRVSGSYQRNTTDVDVAARSLSTIRPKAVMIFGQPFATSAFIKKCLDAGFKPIFIATAPILGTSAFLKDMAGLSFDLFADLVAPLSSDDSVPFVKRHQIDMQAAGFADVSQASLEGYIAATVFVEGLRKAGPNLTRLTFKAALEQITDLEVGGQRVSFTPSDHQGLKKLFLARIKDGKLIMVPDMK